MTTTDMACGSRRDSVESRLSYQYCVHRSNSQRPALQEGGLLLLRYDFVMRVLIVEDSRRLRESLERGLRRMGYGVDAVGDGRQGLIHAQTTEYDLIVLDLMLPELDGLSLLRAIREKGLETHVLILSARDRVEQRIEGLRTGADDYLVKPFSFEELVARIEALLRRSHGRKTNTLEIGRLMIDLGARVALVDGEDIGLARRDFTLLEYLGLEAGRAVSRSEIEEHLYDDSNTVWSNAVDSAIASLRKSLTRHGVTDLIVTRRGIGYMLDPNAESVVPGEGGEP